MPRLKPAATAAARRRHGAETTPGRCATLDYCSIGMQRVLVEIPVSEPFICPECGGKLRPPASRRRGRPWVMPALRVAVLFLGVGLGLAVGYSFGRMQPAIHKAVSGVSRETVVQVNTARSLLGLPKLPDNAILKPPAVTPVPPVAPRIAPLVAEHAYPAHAPPLEVADPPVHLQAEERYGQVTIDCSIAALQIKPVCRATDIRGADAFSDRAVAWLQEFEVQYAPGTRAGAPSLLDHRWRIIFQDFSGTQPRGVAAKRK
jgi:hypothetical protein